MEPRIQYATTADGVSIAYWAMGEGVPLVYVNPPPWSHIQLDWQTFDAYRRLAETRRLIRFDNRGSGLSQRDVADFSLDALVRDMEAVVDRLGLEKFAVWAEFQAGQVAVAYAVRHPERISGLILYQAFARARDFYDIPRLKAVQSLLEQGDWELYTETLASVAYGWSSAALARQMAAWMRECTDLATAKAFLEAVREVDVTGLLPLVQAPTLVLQVRQAAFPTQEMARVLAARIPDAQLRLFEWETLWWSADQERAVLDAIDEFLGDRPSSAVAEPSTPGGPVTIMFTDMAGSTGLTQRVGDAVAQETLRSHNAIIREALKAHGGSEIKHTGDGVMASFPFASSAIECAVAIQRAFAAYNESHPDAAIRIRVGLNAGEPVADDKDLFGTSVQLAARVCDHAAADQILISDVVRQLVAGKGFPFSDRGETAIRGFEDPVRLYEVRWREG